METNTLFEQLIAKLRTKSDITSVLICLEDFSAALFSGTTLAARHECFGHLPKEISDILINNLAIQQVTPENRNAIRQRIEELANKLRSCKSIQITLAFEPDEPTTTYLSEWIKKNVDPQMIIDLQFDKTIIGGMLLIAGGVYKDYSVRKKLSNRFQLQRDEIKLLIS